MSFNSYRIAQKLFADSPWKLMRTFVHRAAANIENQSRYRVDRRHGSSEREVFPGSLLHFFSLKDLHQCKLVLKEACLPEDVLMHYLAHRFDLLGSGWVQVKHGMRCRGVGLNRYQMSRPSEIDQEGLWLSGRINGSNLDVSQQLWRLVDKDYIPIDWQLDFKSGYRWSEQTWYRYVSLSPKPGVDIKVPWELARGVHLPQLALAYAAMSGTDSRQSISERIAREVRNQILDFMSTNPIRFGVNWRCAMDVGIRVANWLLAYDLMQAAGVEWDDGFKQAFRSSVYAHGRHIWDNLEWSAELRGNHYLANIVGLLFTAAYLPRNVETDGWLRFSIQELIREVDSQFFPEGANFEASTSYHRLSAEMVAWATALILALDDDKRQVFQDYDSSCLPKTSQFERCPKEFHPIPGGAGESPFPDWYIQRLGKMGEFTMDVTKPSGRIHQVGDNDSGRFFNLQPAFEVMPIAEAKTRFLNLSNMNSATEETDILLESHLDHRSLIATIEGLIPRGDFESFRGVERIESRLVRCLSERHSVQFHQYSNTKRDAQDLGNVPPSRFLAEITEKRGIQSHYQSESFRITLPEGDLLEGLQHRAYRDFGLYLWKSATFYFAIRCGSIGQNGIGGHAHNDQLAIELCVGDEDWIVDPGTYLYLPDSEKRNAYRSVNAHFAPSLHDDREPGRLDQGLFRLVTQAKANCLYFGSDGFVGSHSGFGKSIYRVIQILDNALLVTDVADKSLTLKRQESLGPKQPVIERISFSPGYGIVENRK